MRHAALAFGVFSLAALSLAETTAWAAPASGNTPTHETNVPDVVGGNPAVAGRWDDTASVYIGGGPACTGTLITPDLVLTAGHCIGGVSAVNLGVIDYYDTESGEFIDVVQETEYPNSQSSYDLGLLKLEHASSYTPRVIASGCVNERYLKNGAAVAIVGYGAYDEEGTQYDSTLREAHTTITDYNCTGGRGCNASVSPGGELGAGGGGIDACYGDSGGPLFLQTDIGDYLVGVTSRAYWDVDLPCSEGGIYVRPDAVLDWLESASGETVPRATCNAPPQATADDIELEVEAGEVVSTTIDVTDPDASDTFTLSTGMQPMHGDVVTEDDGSVHYRAHEDYEGPDAFTVRVSDTGVPSLSDEVSFTVTVTPSQGGGCGCRTAQPHPGGAVLLIAFALLALLPRRRRGDAFAKRPSQTGSDRPELV